MSASLRLRPNRFRTLLAFAGALALASAPWAQRGSTSERTVTQLDDPEAFRAPRVLDRGPRSFDSLPPAFQGAANPAIVLTGYWPPSNEALRRFSTDLSQNPDGWIGQDWEGRGYDVYSYFPNFDPRNCNNCGQGSGNLEVDYQDTTADFRPLVEQHAPVAVITYSRGNIDNSWELEMNQYNRSAWINDYTQPFQPTPAPPDASVPAETLRLTTLPAQDIVDAVNAAAIGVSAAICFTGNGGGFLSEFMAYLGVWYRSDHRSPTYSDWCVTAGHVHVGGLLSWPTTTNAARITLREVIAHVDATVAATICQPDFAAGGPGTAQLRFCGDAMASGGTSDLLVEGAPAGTLAVLVASTNSGTPFAWNGGLVYPYPVNFTRVLTTDATGQVLLEGLPGGGGPNTIYTQVVYQDPGQPSGWGFSNTVAVNLLP